MERELNAHTISTRAGWLKSAVGHLETWRPAPLAFARVWLVAALLMVAPSLPVLTLMHGVFIDEIHIAEYGRLFLDPHTSWSIFWQGDHGITPWYFLGATFAELALRATTPSCIGLRLFGLLGTALASAMLAAWLWRRGTRPAAALLFGLLFLFHPLLLAAYTSGRIDGWMLACAFGAGYHIAASATSQSAGRLFAAGGLISLGFFVWPSMVFLLPLLGLELVRAQRRNARALWRSFGIVCSGAALIFLSLGLVVLIHMPNVLSDIPKQLAVAGMTPEWTVSGFLKDIRTLVANLIVRNPWNVPFMFLVWRSGASRAPLAWALLPIAIMLATLLYGNRLIYIVPYLLIAFAGMFALPNAEHKPLREPGPAAWWLLLGSVAAVFVFASVVRPVLPWLHRATRSETLLYSVALAAAPQSSAVCLGGSAIELYVVGRSRDWRMFMLTPETIARCDTAIVRPDAAPEISLVQAAGFRQVDRLLANQRNDAPVWEQHVYGYYAYGPYDVYRRASETQQGAAGEVGTQR